MKERKHDSESELSSNLKSDNYWLDAEAIDGK